MVECHQHVGCACAIGKKWKKILIKRKEEIGLLRKYFPVVFVSGVCAHIESNGKYIPSKFHH